MFSFFRKNKTYTDEEVFQALQEDGIAVTEEEIQKARENDPDALYKIGDTYYKKENYDKSFAWFHRAALQDHAEAQVQVGWMYRHGLGVSQEFKQAMDWFQKAASAGNANAQNNIGCLYFYGEGVSQDYKQAMDWYLKAANNGNTNAMSEIGRMYHSGKGATRNIPSAIKWYTKAANQGNKHAQNNLGVIYQREDGFEDLQKAVNWYQRALDNGHPYAKNKVKELNEQGYYAKEEEQEDETIQNNNATDAIINNQNQPSTTSNNEEHLNKMFNDEIKAIEKTFQSKMSLMEVNTDALQKELAALKQEKLQQHEEIKELREKLARTGPRIDGSHNGNLADTENDYENDINYDTECSDSEEKEEVDDVIPTSNMNVIDALQKELAALKEEKYQQQEENRLLKEKLARMEARMQDEAHNDSNYDSSGDQDDNNNDINYDSECSEEDANNHQSRNHRQWFETPADPNYDSSDNEDPRNGV